MLVFCRLQLYARTFPFSDLAFSLPRLLFNSLYPKGYIMPAKPLASAFLHLPCNDLSLLLTLYSLCQFCRSPSLNQLTLRLIYNTGLKRGLQQALTALPWILGKTFLPTLEESYLLIITIWWVRGEKLVGDQMQRRMANFYFFHNWAGEFPSPVQLWKGQGLCPLLYIWIILAEEQEDIQEYLEGLNEVGLSSMPIEVQTLVSRRKGGTEVRKLVGCFKN